MKASIPGTRIVVGGRGAHKVHLVKLAILVREIEETVKAMPAEQFHTAHSDLSMHCSMHPYTLAAYTLLDVYNQINHQNHAPNPVLSPSSAEWDDVF